MIIRIVKLEFKEDKIQSFLDFFETIKEKVNSFPGCEGMKLVQDIKHPTIIMTYSHWETEDALNSYRYSETFGEVWPVIKPWFKERPEAWSLDTYFDGFDLRNK